MAKTNVVIDDDLISRCMEVTGLKTTQSVIDYALQELLRKHQQKNILELQGKINWQGDLSLMRQRR